MAASKIDIAWPNFIAPPLSSPNTLKSWSAVRACTSAATSSAGLPPARLPRPHAVRPASPNGKAASFTVCIAALRGISLTPLLSRARLCTSKADGETTAEAGSPARPRESAAQKSATDRCPPRHGQCALDIDARRGGDRGGGPGAAPERDAQEPPLARFGGWSGLSEDAVQVRATYRALAFGHASAVRLDDLASGVSLLLALHAVEVARVRFAGLYRLCHLSMSPVSFQPLCAAPDSCHPRPA